MRLLSLRSFVLVLALILTASLFAQSQATTGVIEGTVSDASGAAIPGVTISLRNTATNFEQTQVTDSAGRFRGVLLPLGPYEIKASLEGFGARTVKGIDLGVGQTRTIDITLSQAAVSEEIVVTAEAPLIETARTEGATRLDEEAVSDLPNNGRNFLDLTKLTPGVTIVQGPDGDELSINGQKGIANNISVDGADFNNPFFGEQRGGQRPAFTFNLDAVKEMVVVADGANAEFGRSQGGFVNVITKSGTNDMSGTAHLVYKNDSLSSNAQAADGSEAPKFDSNQLQTGFTFGGPLIQDKLFYFTAFDFQKAESTKQTEADRIPANILAEFAELGSPNENAPIDRTNDARVFLGKIDWNATASHLLTARYNYTWSEQENGTFDVNSWGVSANAIEQDRSHSVTGSAISTLRSNLLNEFRFQYAKEERPRPYNGPIITDGSGIQRPLPDTAFDFVGRYRFGMPFFIPVEYYDTRVQFNDNVSILRGAHSIKIGAEYNRVNSVQTFLGFANGRYIFRSADDFLRYRNTGPWVECSDGSQPATTCPAGTTATGGPVLLYLQQAGVGSISVEEAGTQSIPQTEPAVFVQDSWQATPNLNVQYGLRWEAQLQPDPITDPEDVFYAPFIGTTRQGQEFPSNGDIPSDTSMWQPRLGISWNPGGDGRKVLRASAGIFYGRIPGLALASSRSTNGSRGQTIFRSSTVNFDGCLPVYPNKLSASCVGAPDHPDVFVFDEDFQNPRTTSMSLSWEQELIQDYAFLVKYNYAKGEHITRFRNANDPLLINAPESCTFACGPWSSGLGAGGGNGIGVLTVVESTAKSLYQGLTLGVTKRPTNNLSFQAYYTYSKDKSDDDNERDPFSFRYAKVTDLDAEYSYSDRDQRHRLNSWLLWNAPYGVDLNFRYSYRSAQPKSITATGADAATPQDRCSARRPDGACTINSTVTRRNLGRKDNEFSSLDIRLSKQFPVGNGLTIEPALDVFNLFNSANFRRPEVTNLVFNFDGTVQSGDGDPRQMQLGLRVIW
ncbi:MAG TPA: carboxypeptidase regulatory-like domain-containing protein [Thermoanaerobaculia bacterium]|nr:carboxypeptidase regulatory-like domain-containing protein [Thermoanaerobaculia bacterium]